MTSPIETNNVVERERVNMTNEDLIRHARILRNDLAGELPNGVGNTIDALCDRAQSLSDRINVLEGALQLVRRIAKPLIEVDDVWEDSTHIVTAIDNALTQGGKNV